MVVISWFIDQRNCRGEDQEEEALTLSLHSSPRCPHRSDTTRAPFPALPRALTYPPSSMADVINLSENPLAAPAAKVHTSNASPKKRPWFPIPHEYEHKTQPRTCVARGLRRGAGDSTTPSIPRARHHSRYSPGGTNGGRTRTRKRRRYIRPFPGVPWDLTCTARGLRRGRRGRGGNSATSSILRA